MNNSSKQIPAGHGNVSNTKHCFCAQREIFAASPAKRDGFTLIELLMVIGIISLLASILVPSLSRVRDLTRRAMCLSNLHSVGLAIHGYAGENNNSIPFGPKAPPMMSAADFYPATGSPTSLLSLMNGAPVGMGLMLSGQLAKQPNVLFCPGGDQPADAGAELAKVGVHQAQCGYYYRHASTTLRSDPPGVNVLSPEHIRLDNLGNNRNGRPIKALAIDTQFLCASSFEPFGIKPRTQHRRQVANIVFADGHAAGATNDDGRFTFDLQTYQDMMNAFDRILAVLERADAE